MEEVSGPHGVGPLLGVRFAIPGLSWCSGVMEGSGRLVSLSSPRLRYASVCTCDAKRLPYLMQVNTCIGLQVVCGIGNVCKLPIFLMVLMVRVTLQPYA